MNSPSGSGAGLEQAIVEIWCDTLGLSSIAVDDNFFYLGGDSLAAANAATRLSDRLGLRFTAELIMDRPTVAELAANPPGKLEDDMMIRRTGARTPLTLLQRGLLAGSPAAGRVVSRAFRLAGPLDTSALGRAVGDVVRAHPVLRAVVDAQPGRAPALVTRHRLAVPFAVVGAAPAELADAVRMRRYAATAPDAAVLDAVLWELGPRDHALLVKCDRLAADEHGLDVLVRDLGAAYAAARSGGRWDPVPAVCAAPGPGSVVANSYIAAALAFWQRRARGLAAGTEHSASDFRIAPEVVAALTEAARSRGADLTDVVHACLAATLLTAGAAPGPVAVASRLVQRPETPPVVGSFVRMRAAVVEPKSLSRFDELLGRVVDERSCAEPHERVPLEYLWGEHALTPALRADTVELRTAPAVLPFLPDVEARELDDAAGPHTGRIVSAAHDARMLAERFIDLAERVAADPQLPVRVSIRDSSC
ncbi:MAG: hypothetical protein HOQ24_06155 [Mycobacteriaceae bacterium]|nr:hypothetical protein [Mycobacteriaceae bacterium]